jgi:peptide/nickel transport system permease protein
MVQAPVLMEAELTQPRARRGQFRAAWQRFKRNRLAVAGLIWVLIFFIVGVIGPWIAPENYATTNFLQAAQPPSWQHLFGTDTLGHDMFSEVIWSVQNALEIALGASCVAFVIGTVLGLWAGLAGGVTDNLIMRLVDFMFAFPAYFMELILVTTFGRSMGPMLFAIGITTWAGYCRLIRGLVLSMRNGEMVEAARALGATTPQIMRKYLLPNAISALLVALAFGIPGDLTAQAALSIVGMGLPPPLPSLGNMISLGSSMILGYPWLLYFPAGVFAITLLSFLYVADGLQEALNPKL